ncbi:hypothetical protein H9Q73_013026 [Fusarium xylarioides]|nr:hypothetical protein H9Q73_013026 [Fusarium xylarioides]
MISIPKALEEFKLSIGGLWTLDGADTSSEPFYIAKALSAHRNSLRVLDIDVDVGTGANVQDWEVDKNYEEDEDDGTNWEVKDQLDLYGRDRLALDKRISAEHKMESGKEYTPTIGHDVDEHIDELLAKREVKLPNLKAVKGIDERVRDVKDILHDMAVAEVDDDELYVRGEGFESGWKKVEEPE